jgi:quinoprotein glucose dehydrogenase
VLALATALAQASPTVLDGVYTKTQADRGEAVYSTRCIACHEGQDADGPELMGTVFVDRWREDRLESLFTFIKTRMPGNLPGGLDERAYVDVTAYILEANGFPAGQTELTASSVASIQLVGPDGPRPLPNLTIVRVVGCLSAAGGDAWAVVNAGALSPLRARSVDAPTADELKVAAARPLGTQTFRLSSVPERSASYSGHKVQVIGVLNRQNQVERINVMSLESVAPMCGA